jgi:hypothetical protein
MNIKTVPTVKEAENTILVDVCVSKTGTIYTRFGKKSFVLDAMAAERKGNRITLNDIIESCMPRKNILSEISNGSNYILSDVPNIAKYITEYYGG